MSQHLAGCIIIVRVYGCRLPDSKFPRGQDSALLICVFAVPNPVHIVGLIKCLLNEKMNHQQTLIGRLLCDLHGLNFSRPVACDVQAVCDTLSAEAQSYLLALSLRAFPCRARVADVLNLDAICTWQRRPHRCRTWLGKPGLSLVGEGVEAT